MHFNKHFALEGRHASLSASKNAWTNYDEDKMARVYKAELAARRGTALHQLAHDMIKMGIKLEELPKTMNLYVNDAIGYRMSPEVPLVYSDNCFGTPDAVGFRDELLRIHDLKTGVNHTSVRQLEVYAALFCLEYGFKPFNIGMELRIYQSNEVRVYEADPDEIFHIMDKIVTFDKIINEMRQEAEL